MGSPTCGIQAGSPPVTGGLVDKGWEAAGLWTCSGWVGVSRGTQSLVPVCTGVPGASLKRLPLGAPGERQAHPGWGPCEVLVVLGVLGQGSEENLV